MGWRERLRPAEFKGVRFWVQAHSGTPASRRVAVRKFAGRDGSTQIDLGGDPGEFDVIAYLWGEDYDFARDDLEAALAEPGPGALTLPTRGDLWVRVTRPPITSETKDEGGYCSIRFTVVIEDRQAGRLIVRPDARSDLRGSSAALRASAATDFAATVDAKSLPERYMAATLSTVDGVTRKIASIQRLTQGIVQPITALTTRLDSLNQTANTLLSTPSLFATTTLDAIFTAFTFADTIVGGVDRATGLPAQALTPFQRGQRARLLDRAGQAFANLGEPFVQAGFSSLARRGETNTIAVYRLARAGALAAQADAYASAEFDSATFALSALQRALYEAEALFFANPTDELYIALVDLRAKLTSYILETASRLPETLSYKPPREVPAILLAYDLYGDLAMEADIVARNRIANPLFVDGELEVLSP